MRGRVGRDRDFGRHVTVPIWARVLRSVPASATAAAGLLVTTLALAYLRVSVYRDTSSVAPALVCAALVVGAVVAIVSTPLPEDLTQCAVRPLAGTRLLGLLPAILTTILVCLAAAVALGDRWFVAPFVQACSVSLAIACFAHVLLPAPVAPTVATAYTAICYFGGARASWNMILHDRSPTLAVTCAMLAVMGVITLCLRGPKARPATDTED